MLDSFEIITASGLILWSRTYTPVSSHIINSLIRDVFIEEKQIPLASSEGEDDALPEYRKDQYSVKWSIAKDLQIVFVAVYQSLLRLTWVDDLIRSVKKLFVAFYADQFKKPNTSVYDCEFDEYFDQRMRVLEVSNTISTTQAAVPLPLQRNDVKTLKPVGSPAEVNFDLEDSRPNTSVGLSDRPESPDGAPSNQRKLASVNHLLTAGNKGPGGRVSRRAKKSNNNTAQVSSREDSPSSKSSVAKGSAKKKRTWTADGLADEDDGTTLDYSMAHAALDASETTTADVDEAGQARMGSRNKQGQFVLRDLDEEVDAVLSQKDGSAQISQGSVSGLGVISSLFKNLVGGKTLTAADLDKPLKGMEDHLLQKNVAREATLRLCDSVRKALVGTKTSTFQTIDSLIRSAMEPALEKILTPTTSLDLLRSIEAVKSRQRRPYVISIVGVNGVGKSTNLGKLAFFLLQNRYRILITACDTFRSGAVEQLAVHVRNLNEQTKRVGGYIELYERGYGKDAANVARDAIQYAASPTASASNPNPPSQPFDIVLIDTAGRRHNDARLMSSLAKFAQFAQPDKIFMVAEALVGTDSVMQARNFNDSFGNQRKLDGFIVSKCDTVGSGIGTVVSLVHATGIPVVFLGVGQMYPDLRTLNVKSVVGLLMK